MPPSNIWQYLRFGPTPGTTDTPPPAGIAALAMIYIFAAAFNAGWGPVAWIYISEIPTNRLRAYNVALGTFTHWVMNLVVSKTTPYMLAEDPYRTYFIFGSFNAVMAIIAFWLPETKGVSNPTQHLSINLIETDISCNSCRWSAWTSFSVQQTSPRLRMLALLRSTPGMMRST